MADTIDVKDQTQQQPPTQTPAPLPDAASLLARFGCELREPLDPRHIRRFRRSLPGYASVLETAAKFLAAEDTRPPLPGVTVADIKALEAHRASLVAAEAVLQTAYRSVYEERLALDDRGVGYLRRLWRAVARAESRELENHWGFLRAFLGTFQGGRRRKTEEVTPKA